MVAPNSSPANQVAPIASTLTSSKASPIGLSNGCFSTVTQWTPRILGAIVGILILGFGNAAMALQKGATGQAVVDLQEALTASGCYNGPVNGNFADMTEAGVIECQTRFGLSPDGVAGPRTMAQLQGRSMADQPWGGRANPTATVDSRDGVVERGASGDTVSFIQMKLQQFNFYTGPIDGQFGPQTEAAVRQFQQVTKLPIDGKVGSEEMAKFDSYEPPNVSTTQSPSRIVLSRNQLAMGDSGTDVEHLQDQLRAVGYFQRSSTGNYGNITREAVIDFQRSRSFRATGVADAMTLESLGLQPGTQVSAAPVWQPSNGFTTASSSTSIHQSLPTRAVTPNSRYVVVIPKQNEQTLEQVRRVIRGAQMFSSHKGDYIMAGTSTTRAGAEKRSNYLRSVGLDARVDYQ